MVDRNLHTIENALKSIAETLSRIEKNGKTAGASFPTTQLELQRIIEANQPRTQSGHLTDSIPLEIDWTPAAIKTCAQFIKHVDGRVTIVIEVVGEDADILLESIDDVPVEYLQLSSVVK